MKTTIKILCAFLVALSLVGCKSSLSEHDEQVYEEGFEAGYEEALYSDDYYAKLYDDLYLTEDERVIDMVNDFMLEDKGREIFYSWLEEYLSDEDERTLDIIKIWTED